MTFIRPIEFNGMVQRTQDVSTMKQNEDNRPIQEQGHIQQTVQKQAEHTTREVAKKDNADRNQEKFDAKEKGKGEYSRPNNQRKKTKQTGDRFVEKKGSGGFDIKI